PRDRCARLHHLPRPGAAAGRRLGARAPLRAGRALRAGRRVRPRSAARARLRSPARRPPRAPSASRARRSALILPAIPATLGCLYARASIREGGAVVTTQRTTTPWAPLTGAAPGEPAPRDPLGLRA